MRVIIVEDKVAGGKEACKVFANALANGAKVLGLATGGTPETTYQELVASKLDFSNLVSVNLDEYVGLGPDNPQSYNYYMKQHLFDKKPFAKSYLPNGLATDEEAEIARYNEILADNPVDLQLLGIGENGHIGFNEPGSPLDAKTRKVALTESTIKANARYFEHEEDVPRYAYSMGIGSIMQAKEILLEAFGAKKAQAVKALVEGQVDASVPATILQKHPNVTVIVDKQAAALLTKK
ncbi:glucosamine-6-phosphate deaminase [Ligilactobacillus agilis]|uniref:Glucosamine-6-phosphate deaminase n=1 Tax=Ligilactobacillus agilis TaxID=1601 RepID=A0A6F9XQ40_9LACO|nr:glucosamine-6-phosphate deaminase [Ligilactobacillus agilis]GET07393.1 glucosamine-6-phosphate deaminase [Ligilactobacillus agilis]